MNGMRTNRFIVMWPANHSLQPTRPRPDNPLRMVLPGG